MEKIIKTAEKYYGDIKKRSLGFNDGQRFAVSHFIDGGHFLWRKLAIYVAFPVIGVLMVKTLLDKREPQEAPEFVAYEHMRIRKKRFPWGDGEKTLFHNPEINALPDGYEKN